MVAWCSYTWRDVLHSWCHVRWFRAWRYMCMTLRMEFIGLSHISQRFLIATSSQQLSASKVSLWLWLPSSCYRPVSKTVRQISLIFGRETKIITRRQILLLWENFLISMATDWNFLIPFSRGGSLTSRGCLSAISSRSAEKPRRRSQTNKQPNKWTENSNYSMIIKDLRVKVSCCRVAKKFIKNGFFRCPPGPWP